jgi:carboxymethylenebutenolidase
VESLLFSIDLYVSTYVIVYHCLKFKNKYRKVWIFFFLLSIGFPAVAQKMMSCCSPSAIDAFSQLASDKAFKNSHAEPLPFVFQSEKGSAIVFKASDGNDAYGWEIKSNSPSDNYIFIIDECWGLNDYIKKNPGIYGMFWER